MAYGIAALSPDFPMNMKTRKTNWEQRKQITTALCTHIATTPRAAMTAIKPQLHHFSPFLIFYRNFSSFIDFRGSDPTPFQTPYFKRNHLFDSAMQN
ncbi:MAG: hypothetical protein JWO95_223, partial [Verrucomicrobiales bacterium]|nr:hypothetical protein [Verrucomicrobiales bacterium]